ncbi:MAG TPA: alpha-amylase family glycosyl hydrolase [Erysipelotrichaceae bacterium]|nr:alpha-amylase family glycosyl hydrolase [Erysipelotrichaceae bacterium]
MNDYFIRAYLDDYKLITIEMDISFFDGECNRFDLIKNELIIPLNLISKTKKNAYYEYKYSFDADIVVSQPYEVMGINGYRTPLVYRYIVKTERFNQQYYYDDDDLGSVVINGITTFKLWAPTANNVILSINDKYFKMNRNEVNGVYSLAFNGDLTGSLYNYIVSVNGNTYTTIDPYGKASTANSKQSVVANLIKAEPSVREITEDPVIYEVCIRDYSESGTFDGLIPHLDYISELGISHIQLLPVNDFGSVNDYHKDIYYNWGYDPVQYQALDNSYCYDPTNPLLVIDEFKNLCEAIHHKKMKVVLDVVFNHHYYASRSSFNQIVPYYYFRYDKENKFYEGSFCGAELDTGLRMCRKYIIDTLVYFVKQYDVDGFRFDLMSFIDIETMLKIEENLKSIKEDVMLYGEGWVMKTSEKQLEMANYSNSRLIKNISFFNDEFRDVIKGNSFDYSATGYGTGNIWMAKKAIEVMKAKRFFKPSQSINYVECHDDMACFDKLNRCCINETHRERIQRQKLLISCILLSRGISFLHAGQEFCRSKNGIPNTYNAPDSVNKINHRQKEEYYDVVRFTKNLIEIKKKYNFGSASVSYSEKEGIIIGKYQDLTFIINPSQDDFLYSFRGTKQVILDDGGRQEFIAEKEWLVKRISTVILREL